MKNFISLIVCLLVMISCGPKKEVPPPTTFGSDVSFLNQYTPIITLSSPDGQAKVALSAALQGRVMTSTASGDDGISFGWINRELFASRDTLPHMNPFGGEERFWLGPEGGQFALFFKKGDPFDFDHWQTPAILDTEPFEVLSQSETSVVFTKEATLTNYAGFEFKFSIRREIKILPIEERNAQGVAYQSINTLTNTGDKAWNKDTGLISIWLLGMFNPTDETVVMIPFNRGQESKLGPPVIDDYFGKVPANRLKINDNTLFFIGDGKLRSKIGLNPRRAKNVLGSYDGINKVLTVLEYSKPDGVTDYVNSKWETQKEPYGGDVVNSYNDGPPAPGAKPMGPFYELETSSPAVELKPGESIVHTQTTRHYLGNENQLNSLAERWLGVSLKDEKIFVDYFFNYDSH
jgi:hypothetical protein